MNMNINTLWFNKRTKEQGAALKALSKIIDNTWSVHCAFEDLFFGTYIHLYKNVSIKELEEMNESINCIDGLSSVVNYREHTVEIQL